MPIAALRALAIESSLAGAVHSYFLTPASAAKALIASIAVRMCLWPNITAPSMTSSDSTLASDSTISTALAVPATTSSSCEVGS